LSVNDIRFSSSPGEHLIHRDLFLVIHHQRQDSRRDI